MTTTTDLPNTTENIRRISNTSDSNLGEGGPAIVFDVPADLNYDKNNIEDVLWNGSSILLWYSPPEFGVGNIHFSTAVENDTIVVTGYSPGLLSADEVYNKRHRTPHAKSLRPIYDWLQSEGIEFADLK